jgi:hypothetical protein
VTSVRRIVRNPRDVAVLAATLGHAVVLAGVVALAAAGVARGTWPVAVALIAFGVNWGSNTFSHIHLHTPLFSGRRANRAFSLGLSVTLAIPQTWWKHRHLAHHRGRAPDGVPSRLRGPLANEITAILVLWAALAFGAPGIFLAVVLPGWALGLALCWLQGHFEHAHHAAGVDHHGAFYNRFWFHDGFHAAHHVAPGAHWSTLGPLAGGVAPVSAFPPVLRWLDSVAHAVASVRPAIIDALERHGLRFAFVRALLVATHRRAFAAILSRTPLPPVRRVCIVGGGLFPRTAIVLRELLPDSRLTILDSDAAHLECAQGFLVASPWIEFRCGRFPDDPGGPYDLVVVPLAFRGDRVALYAQPPAPVVIVHEFFWRRGGGAVRASAMVSWWLGKRVNLLVATAAGPSHKRDPAAKLAVASWLSTTNPPLGLLPGSSRTFVEAIGRRS